MQIFDILIKYFQKGLQCPYANGLGLEYSSDGDTSSSEGNDCTNSSTVQSPRKHFIFGLERELTTADKFYS